MKQCAHKAFPRLQRTAM